MVNCLIFPKTSSDEWFLSPYHWKCQSSTLQVTVKGREYIFFLQWLLWKQIAGRVLVTWNSSGNVASVRRWRIKSQKPLSSMTGKCLVIQSQEFLDFPCHGFSLFLSVFTLRLARCPSSYSIRRLSLLSRILSGVDPQRLIATNCKLWFICGKTSTPKTCLSVSLCTWCV